MYVKTKYSRMLSMVVVIGVREAGQIFIIRLVEVLGI